MNELEKQFLNKFDIDPSMRNDKIIRQICNGFSNIPKPFMRKYADKLIWKDLCRTQHLSNKFMDEMCDYIDFDIISWAQRLTEWFIDKWKDHLDWIAISNSQKMSKDFIIEHLDYVQVFNLFSNKHVLQYGEEFMRTLLTIQPDCHFYYSPSTKSKNFSEEFMREFGKNFIIVGKIN